MRIGCANTPILEHAEAGHDDLLLHAAPHMRHFMHMGVLPYLLGALPTCLLVEYRIVGRHIHGLLASSCNAAWAQRRVCIQAPSSAAAARLWKRWAQPRNPWRLHQMWAHALVREGGVLPDWRTRRQLNTMLCQDD